MSDDCTPPSRADLHWLIGHIDRFEQPGMRFGQWHSHERTSRAGSDWWYWAPSREVNDFLNGFYEHHLIIPFDWSNWDRLEHYKARPESVQSAPLDDCLKLLTAHVRSDRFVEGHFASTLESGDMQRLLRRIRDLLEAEGGEP